jgi:hypothetical protein
MNASDGLAWHYTTGHICRKILECGLLVPTAIGIKPPETGLAGVKGGGEREGPAQRGGTHPQSGQPSLPPRSTGYALFRFCFESSGSNER